MFLFNPVTVKNQIIFPSISSDSYLISGMDRKLSPPVLPIYSADAAQFYRCIFCILLIYSFFKTCHQTQSCQKQYKHSGQYTPYEHQ